jgi:hypothetical protein
VGLVKAKLLLGEAATGHPDGTVSILRAGITHAWGDGPQVPFQGALIARVEADSGDAGPAHTFDLRCMDADGTNIMPPLSGQFIVQKGGGLNNIILGMQMMFPKHGEYTFVLRVDNVQLDSWKVTAAAPPKPKE